MMQMPDVGLGGVTAVLPLAVTAASKDREMITRIFLSCEDIVTLCQCGLVSGKTFCHSILNRIQQILSKQMYFIAVQPC